MKHLKTYLYAAVILFLLNAAGCISARRFRNYGWQLDSLRFYTGRIDSMLEDQGEEIARLRIDLYTKTNELSDKIEMLNSRLSETELQLTRIYERVGTGRKAPADSEDISQIAPEARMIYESAYLNYVKGNYDESISGFESYMKIQPDSPISDNALYWIGECYTAMGKSQSAVNTFQDLIAKYPQSNRRPTALYKTGIIYEEAGDAQTAKKFYNKVILEFPNSPEATLARDKLK